MTNLQIKIYFTIQLQIAIYTECLIRYLSPLFQLAYKVRFFPVFHFNNHSIALSSNLEHLQRDNIATEM